MHAPLAHARPTIPTLFAFRIQFKYNLPGVVDLEKNTPSTKKKRITVLFILMDVRLQS